MVVSAAIIAIPVAFGAIIVGKIAINQVKRRRWRRKHGNGYYEDGPRHEYGRRHRRNDHFHHHQAHEQHMRDHMQATRNAEWMHQQAVNQAAFNAGNPQPFPAAAAGPPMF